MYDSILYMYIVIAVEKLILTNLVACKIEMKICTFHVDCHKQRHILDKNY